MANNKPLKNFIHIESDGKDVDTSRSFSKMSYKTAAVLLLELEGVKQELLAYVNQLENRYDISIEGEDDEEE